MRAALAGALAAGALAVAAPAKARGIETDPEIFGQASVGVFCTQDTGRQSPAPGSVAGHSNIVDGIEMRAATPVVPVAQDLTFGFRAEIREDVPDATMRIVHPPFRDSGATEQWFDKALLAGEDAHGLYSFDEDYEMVVGLWRFELWEGERVLATFEVRTVPASLAPHLVGLCAGEALLGLGPWDGPRAG